MNKYVTAIFSHAEGENRIFLLDAENDVDAAKKSLIAHCPEKYRDQNYIDWVNSLGETLEDVFSGAIQSELVLTPPLQVSTINTLASLTQTGRN